ncbi:MFS transporter [Brevibacterium luteolum]|uniref:MFS transporter n=1 Tax=Brevibacterium luteolum TaxID=199591 RepID=UPI00223B9108|nr:MFS transporter [Brevibacterium luteolum]MCT1873915.1 MFS transporter [Brevibacterium luteolum]MCT1891222.1 MFS transporter [Brevibacterium luteolum]MCT1894232.1 MFS transporter [Brevibacterium luteolum]MCT1924663.1 MFS transporter [Brevibacterium luteolum]
MTGHPGAGASAAAPQPLWTGQFLLAFGINFVLSLSFYVFITSMAGYAATEFGAGSSVAGLTASAFIIGATVARIIAGKYLDFIGRRTSTIAALVLFVMSAVAYVFADQIWLVIVIRLIHGAAFGWGSNTITAVAQWLIPQSRRSEGTGYFGTSTTLSAGLGPFLAVWLSGAYGYTAVFIMCAGFSVVGVVFSLLLRPAERAVTPEERALKWRLSLGTIIDYRSVRIATVMLLAGLSYSVVLAFLQTFANEEDFGAAASVFFMVFSVAMLLGRLFVGRLQDAYGDNVVVYPLIVSFTLSLVVIGLAPAGWVIIAAAIPAGLGFGSLFPSIQAIAVTLAGPARAALAVSTFFIFLDVGTGLGPVVLGALTPAIGLRGVYLVAAGLMVVALGLYWLFHGRRQQR